jgi:hypothetical protein
MAYKIVSNTGVCQCEFLRNRWTTDQIFCVRQRLQKKWECNGALHQLFVDSEKACDSKERSIAQYSDWL